MRLIKILNNRKYELFFMKKKKPQYFHIASTKWLRPFNFCFGQIYFILLAVYHQPHPRNMILVFGRKTQNLNYENLLTFNRKLEHCWLSNLRPQLSKC